jgi:ferredoxin
VIDGSRCLECGVCIRICPTNAVEFVEPPYPLKFKVLSNPANVGTTLADVVKILRKLEEVGVELERENPQMLILEDLRSGRLSYEDLEGIRIMSVVLEVKTSLSSLPRVIKALRDVEKEVNTVFSVGVICRFEDDMSIPCLKVLEELGVTPMPFAKINLGLGRPLVTD